MPLLQDFQNYIRSNELFAPTDKLLVALSGGLDSVVLAQLCQDAGLDFILAHCNFKLRGAESDRDEQFARATAERLGRRIFVQTFDTEIYAGQHKQSIQVAARELRYTWFAELLSTEKLSCLLTAHHRDDNIETLLMNFFKGTGIAGLHGILPRQENIVRPLLFAGKQALVDYAKEHSLSWVEDSSNTSDKYARNYLRHQVVPLLQTIYPGVENNLAENITRFGEIEQVYRSAVALQKKRLLVAKGAEVHIPVLKLKKAVGLHTIVYELIRDFNFSAAQTTDVLALLDSETGRYVQSPSHRIIRNRAWLIIAPNETEKPDLLVIDGPGEWPFAQGRLNITHLTNRDIPVGSDVNTVMLDDRNFSFPLILRKWKQGDYFYPLGMTKKKKVARFLIDQKISKTDKEKVWVLELDQKIIWVVGLRIDDRFKINESTKGMVRIQVVKKNT